MAWNIGANDVANAMGTSVGSHALTMRQAVVVAGLLEFAGAMLLGGYVTDTVRKGIVDPAIFAHDPMLLAHGMTAALAAAAIWLNLATVIGWPVSTTHSIVGAITGFGIVVGGLDAVHWGKLGTVVSSWVVSPLTGGLSGYLVYALIRRRVLQQTDPAQAARRNAPLFAAGMLFVLALALLFNGLKNLHLELTWLQSSAIATITAAAGYLAVWLLQRRRGPATPQLRGMAGVETVFRYLQVASAAFVAFAHGANDVANAVGPMAATFAIVQGGTVAQQVPVPFWILLAGGAGIVLGLATYGYKVIATIGSNITEVTPSRGFSAELGAALTVLVGSKLGLPLSTTHTLVGAVIGVGFARGMSALNLGVIRGIIVSWLITIPFAASVCVAIFYLLRAVF